MEHYPTVLDPYQSIITPFLGGNWDPGADLTCSDLDLDVFRLRLQEESAEPEEELQVIAKIQARLFFGMLSGVLQIQVSTSDYVIDKSENRTGTLTTRALKQDLHRWKAEHERLRTSCHSESRTSTDETEAKDAALELAKRREKAESCLNDAFIVWKTLEITDLEARGRAHHEDFMKVWLSLQMLGKTLEHAIESVSQYCDQCTFEPWVHTHSVPWRRHSQNLYLTDRMENQGWCPTVIEALRKKGNLPLMYYASILGPPTRTAHKDAGCVATDKGCRLLDIRNIVYEPLHTEDCPRKGCNFLGPGEAGMKKATTMIEQGNIPILYLDDRGELQVEQQRFGLEYTAISHVWADGLGNPKRENVPGWQSNSLPACQIRRIVRLVSELPWPQNTQTAPEEYNDKVWKRIERAVDRPSNTIKDIKTAYFWIDTICVPHNTAKQKAITQMAAVYSRANRVLVLDADLMATSLHVPTKAPVAIQVRPDFGAKVIGSSWQKRYWTLQEAVLARKLWIQFKDDAYIPKTWADLVAHNVIEKLKRKAEAEGEEFDLSKLSTPLELPTRPNFIEYWWDNEICYYAEPEEFSWGNMGIGNVPPEKLPILGQNCTACANLTYGACAICRALCARAHYAWRELDARACSVPTDKPLCIAILLDLDVSVFENVTDEAEHIQKLWKLFTVVPAGLLSLPSRKCKESHLRWAPADLDHLSRFGNPVWHPAHITPEGVHVKLHGFTAKVTYSLKATSVIPVALGDMVYYVRNNTNFHNARWVEGPAEKRILNVDFQGISELGVILGQEPLGEGQPFPRFPAALGTLVSVRRRETGQVIVVEYLGAVSVIGKGTMFERLTTTPWTDDEQMEKLAEPLIGQPTPVNQRWLIAP